MARNIQEFANSASNYRDLDLETVLKKKRGRSCTRRERRTSNIDSRIIRDRLAAQFAQREYSKEMNHFENTVSEGASRGIHDIPMPQFLIDLSESAHLAEANLKSAHISKAAMSKFPPL